MKYANDTKRATRKIIRSIMRVLFRLKEAHRVLPFFGCPQLDAGWPLAAKALVVMAIESGQPCHNGGNCCHIHGAA